MNKELTCAELVEQLTELLEAVVDEPTRQRLFDHLAGCEGCRNYREQFVVITHYLGRLPPEDAEGRSRNMRQMLTAAYRQRTGT